MRIPSFLITEHAASLPGVGTFYLHEVMWRRGKIHAMGFQPEGRTAIHTVPEVAWGQMEALILRTDPRPTYEEVMAVLRRAQQGAAESG